MIAAGYTMNLYCGCDYCKSHTWKSPEFGEYTGRNWSECASDAKKYGWFISKDRTYCLCPAHR